MYAWFLFDFENVFWSHFETGLMENFANLFAIKSQFFVLVLVHWSGNHFFKLYMLNRLKCHMFISVSSFCVVEEVSKFRGLCLRVSSSAIGAEKSNKMQTLDSNWTSVFTRKLLLICPCSRILIGKFKFRFWNLNINY